jgi:hypothetical protein
MAECLLGLLSSEILDLNFVGELLGAQSFEVFVSGLPELKLGGTLERLGDSDLGYLRHGWEV